MADSSAKDSKRVKTNGKEKMADYNPYLAHQYEGAGNGGGDDKSILDTFTRQNTTAQQHTAAEDAEINPWTNKPHSQQYFNILKTRRDLPVQQQRQEFLDMYHKSQILVFVGETGSGKTTQIPQYVLFDELPYQTGKLIACTQPRRVAAMSVAQRVASELDVSYASARFSSSATHGPDVNASMLLSL